MLAVQGRHVGFCSWDFHWIPADWYFRGELEYEDEEEGEDEDEDGNGIMFVRLQLRWDY